LFFSFFEANRLSIAKDTMRDYRSATSCKSRLCNCIGGFWGRCLNLEHAKMYSLENGPRKLKDRDSPEAILEIKKNVENWKQRVHTQINMAFFLNKVIRIFFWILLLSFIPVTSILLRFFLCDPIADEYYLNADLRVMCNSEEYNQM
jgi:hypothetical protein